MELVKEMAALPTAGDLLKTIILWRSKQTYKDSQHTLQASIESRFQALYGCTVEAVRPDELEKAIDQLSNIIHDAERSGIGSAEDRLNLIIQHHTQTVAAGVAKTKKSDVASLLSALELANITKLRKAKQS